LFFPVCPFFLFRFFLSVPMFSFFLHGNGGSPSHHGFQYSNGPVTWIASVGPYEETSILMTSVGRMKRCILLWKAPRQKQWFRRGLGEFAELPAKRVTIVGLKKQVNGAYGSRLNAYEYVLSLMEVRNKNPLKRAL
jgi:hypothetical protein